MSKNVNHIQHIKSNVVENGKPKLPLASALVEGEIAVNYAEGYETISLKNSSGDIVTFSSDNYYTAEKLGSGFTGDNSAKTVTEVIEENEEITSAALNDLEERKLDASAYTPTDLSNYYTKDETSGATEIATALDGKQDVSGMSAYTLTVDLEDKLGSGFTGENSGVTVTEYLEENEKVTAAALNDLETNKLDASAYTPTDLSNYYTKSQTSGATEISTALGAKVNSQTFISHTGDSVVHITNEERATWNAKADKSWVEDKLGSGFTGENSGVTVTEYLEENEEIMSAALNDLEANKLDASAYTPTDLSNYYTKSQTSGATEIATALNAYADSVNYNSTSHTVEFYHGTTAGTKVFEFDASAFIIDGMVDNVEIDDVTSGSSTVKCLVVSFNTDAGKQDITIPISDIFDPDIYYTKDEIDDNELVIASALNDLNVRKLDASAYTPTDLSNYYTKSETSGATEISTALDNKQDISGMSAYTLVVDLEEKLGSAFTGDNSAKTVTDVIEENEEITSAAFNDLDERKLDASAYTPTDLSNYYTKSQTSGATEISNALGDKQDASGMTAYTTNAHLDEKLGSAFTGANSAVTVTEALENVEIDVDQIIDSGTSASTNAVATQAVYSAVTDNELVWTNAYVALSAAVSSHTANTSIHRVDKVSKSQISSNNTTVSCPADITGATNDGAQTTVIYENTSTTTDYTVTVASGYKTPNGGSMVLTCPANGFCKVTYINIGGTIYASGN